MSCNCIGNFYTDSNGNQQPLTEFMCFEIIAQNSFCCDTFDKSCLNTIYFDSTAENYVGCYGCPSDNTNCCYLIQIEANRLNPEENSQCCENFDSYCVEAYETLKNTKGNFCSDTSSLKDYYVNTYSTDYRPCNFSDEQADRCITELNCSQINSEQCLNSLYSKLTDFSSVCQCTCFKQARYLSTCMLNVIHRDPTCCHSWTAECEAIKEQLQINPGDPCSLVASEGDGSLAGLDPPGTLSCGCTIKGLPTFDDVPCCFKRYCQDLQNSYELGVLQDGPYNCNDLGVFLNKFLTSTDLLIPDCQPTDYPLAGGPPCPNTLCNGCDYFIPSGNDGWLSGYDNICPGEQCPKWPWGAIEGCNVKGADATDSSLGTPPRNPPTTGAIYPVSHNHNDCAYAMALPIYSYGCSEIFSNVEEMQDFILNLAKRFANPEQEIEIQATNCSECCSICRFFGKESLECSGCVDTFNFATETPAINNDNYLVYEGQGITFIASPVRTQYLYYQLVSALGLPVIDKNDIDASGNGINGKPLGMTGLLGAVGDIVKFNLKMKSDGSFEGPEYFRVKLIEQSDLNGCAHGTFLSNAITVKEPPTFTLSGVPSNCQVNEGTNLSLTITTTNFPVGTIYYRIISIIGASSEDFGISMSGSLSIVNSSATLNIPILADQITEGSGEKFKVEFSITSSFDSIVATTNNSCPNGIQINDTSVTPLNVTITASPTNPNEGTIVTFQIQANQAGTYYYTINSNGSPFVPGNDFIANTDPLADVNSSGSFNITVPNGTATIYKRINPDSLTESTPESFFMEIRKDSTSGSILTSSSIITIIDSSGTPSYNISGPLTVVEGNDYTYNVVTTNSAFSTLHYRIVAVNNSTITTADFGIPLTGSFTLSPSGTYNLLLPVLEGELEAPEESFKIELWSNGSYIGSALASTQTIKILDTTQNVSISQTSTLITEEQSVTFTVTTINIDEEILTYKIVSTSGNIVAGDFTPPSLTENFNLTGSTTKTGNFTLTLANNSQYEGQEKFKVEIYKPLDTTPIITSNEITVVDADSTLSVSTSAISVVEGNSFNITVNYTNYPNPNVYYRLETAYGAAIDPLDFSGGLNGAIPVSASSTSVTHTIQTLERDIYSGIRGFYVVVSNISEGDGESTGIIQLIDANPDYTEIQVPVSVIEGNSFNFTVNGTNIPNGTILYYQIIGLSSSDIVGGSLTGNFNVVNNTATVTIGTVNNTAFEGPETFTIKIFTNSALTIEVLESTQITLFDGTKVYGPLSPNSGNIVEGTSQSFSFATENIATGTTVYYKIISVSGPVTADDFSPATLTGSFNIGSSFNITLANNIASELNDVFKIQIYSDSSFQQLKYTSGNFTIKDAAPKYFIVADKNTVDEGGTVSFDVTTENVPNGTNLIYYITGDTNQFDFVPVGITGAVTINNNFYNFSLGISADLSTETGGEQFQVVIKQNDAGPDLSEPTSPITISDTSVSYYTITPTSGSIVEGNAQTFTVTGVGSGTDGTFYYGITGIKGGQELQETDFVDGFVDSFNISSGSGSFTITTVQNDSLNRQFTVKVGSTNDPYNSVLVETGIFNITDLNADYTVTPSTFFIIEGQGITFNITALNVPNGTVLQYAITSTNGVNSSDFVGGLNGTVTIQNQSAILFKQTVFNPVFEGQQSFSVKFYITDPNNPEIISQEINLVDALPEITQISPNGCITCGCSEGQVQEGETVSYTVNGTNIQNGSQYNAILQLYPGQNGFISSDVSPASQTITFNNNTASFNVNISTTGINQLYEGTDEYIVRIRQGTTVKKESGCFTIIDAPPSATITPSVSSLQEGQEITFNVSVQNVPNNSLIQYKIIGLSEDDLVDGQLSGNITVIESGNDYVGSVTKRISTDSVFGEVESLVFVIYYNDIELDRTSEIPIVDTTPPTVPTYTLTISDRSVGPGQSFTITLTTTNVPNGTEFEFRTEGLFGYVPNPDDFIPKQIVRTGILPKNNKIILDYEIFEDVEENFSFNIHVYRVITGLVDDYELVAISEQIRSTILDSGCQNGPISGTYGEDLSLCSVCDNACGYVSFWGTADAFVGYRSEPLRQATSTAICDTLPPGQCPTENCPNYGSPCEYCEGSESFDCACKTAQLNSVSYARFTNKQFITVLENGVYKNRKIEEPELIAYRNSEITVPVYTIQGHDNLCPPPPTVCGKPYDSGAGMNVSCVAGYGGGYNSCYQYQNDSSWNGLLPDTQTFFETGPMWTTTFSSGINAIRKSYGDAPLFGNSDIGCVNSVILPAVVPIGSEIDDDLFANYRCANQNYLLGAPNPPEGITAAFIADHLNESFTEELCNLIHSCSRAGEGDICQTYFLANCKEQMDSPCLTRAERYAIINGCTGAYGFTLNNNFVYSSNRDDFVWFFQGIRAGNYTTTSPGNMVREEYPIIEGTTDIREVNQCFTYYPVNIDPNENCLIADFFADPIYYFGTFETDLQPYIPDLTDSCDATIVDRNVVLVPPQHTGCCYKKNENDSSVNSTKQFRTISYFSKDSFLKPKVLEYLNSLNANFRTISAVGSLSASDFYNDALCEFFMPRHPYFEGPPEGAAAGSYESGALEYAYGYKPAYGAEGKFYGINTCRKYDLYYKANEIKRDDLGNTTVLITGYPNTYFSLEGELLECQDVGGGGGVGSSIVSGVGFLGDDTTESPTALCLIDRGIKNPLTPWPATEEARDGRIHTSNAYVVQIIGHDGGLNNPKLPNNNAPKVFNACFPCRGFIDLPMQGDNPIDDAVFAEYADIGDGIQRLIIKSYTKEGNYSGHSVGSILARMTLKDQIKQENIYYKDIAEYSLILIGSGIEILHTREVSKKEFYEVLNWNSNPTGITSSSNSRAEKLALVYYTGVPLESAFNVNNIQYYKVYWPFGSLLEWSVGENRAFKDTGGYIGQQGQNVSAYVGRRDDQPPPKFADRVNANTVHGIFENGLGQATRFITNSDRNAKVNNNIGILRVHKEYDMGGGHKIPNCREKFETLNRDLTNCDLPNNLVMNGMCWITTVLQKDIWEHSHMQDWVMVKELEDPDNTKLNLTTFEDWITTTRLTITFDEFIIPLNHVISVLKADQPSVYIGTGALNSIPTPITEELYSMRRGNEYVYNMNDLKQAAIKSKNNSYSCFDPDGQSGGYNCSDYFCDFFCPSSLEATEDNLINAFRQCDDDICDPNDPSITSNGKFISVPSTLCLQAMVAELENTYFCSGTTKPFTVANIKEVIEIILENRSNPCVFQYNNKVYRIMKEA
jgi:hypothetical protein